jgi:hypothetical protein
LAGDDRRIVVVNFSDRPQPVDGLGGLSVELTSDGDPLDGRTLGPNQAALLR